MTGFLMNITEKQNQQRQALKQLLAPIADFCLNHSIQIQELLADCKTLLLAAAEQQVKKEQSKVTISRLSVMTGLNRRDISALQKLKSEDLETKAPKLAWCVLGRWQQDSQFTTTRGKPRVLSYGSATSEFTELVQMESGHVHPKTVLLELERTGIVEQTSRGIRIIQSEYVPNKDIAAIAQMAASDASDLMRAVEENMANRDSIPNYHLVTEYDNIIPSARARIRRWLLQQGGKFHSRMRTFLSQFDQDLHPALKEAANPLRIVVGGFSLIEECESF